MEEEPLMVQTDLLDPHQALELSFQVMVEEEEGVVTLERYLTR
jgi:hypothetical protein